MKYRSKKTEVDGIVFDSKKEANRYIDLSAREKAGEISALMRQVKYKLTEAYRDRYGKWHPARYYIADFVYRENGETVVEDVKGYKTPEYTLKRTMMHYLKSIDIKEV